MHGTVISAEVPAFPLWPDTVPEPMSDLPTGHPTPLIKSSVLPLTLLCGFQIPASACAVCGQACAGGTEEIVKIGGLAKLGNWQILKSLGSTHPSPVLQHGMSRAKSYVPIAE